MAPSGFKSNIGITHIGTATAILHIDGVNFLTDPFFSPAGTVFEVGPDAVLKNTEDPAMGLEDLPHIDAVLLSHEDHPDNLDELGRQLLNGRHVLTTSDGASKLAPRPDVKGMKPWDKVELQLGGKTFQITATPCQHLPGGECIGFIITTDDFGVSPDGRPNAIYFSGDTVYMDELARIGDMFNTTIAMFNIGNAFAILPTDPLQITMDGKQATQLFRDIKADVLVPMHYESWGHFTQFGAELAKAFEEEGVSDQVRWLVPGKLVPNIMGVGARI
ncbi:putative Zn-dependent hydrolases of the beta-lactamase protein [Ilyonectria destructans]|nr:putative Zn-dependent hydrolases of the beta-lactamase protein [Ilyonectria destructans]